MAAKGRILFLEEKGVLADNVIECLVNHDYQCRHVPNGGPDALTRDDFTDVDAVLVGLHGNGSTRLAPLHDICSLSGGKPVVVLSAIGKPPTLSDVLAAGARGMVNKPFKAQELLELLESSLVPPGSR
jgi:DNA-binding response OmpR family regulator